jgi:WD40 repeat protein
VSSGFDSVLRVWDSTSGKLKNTISTIKTFFFALKTLSNGDLAAGSANALNDIHQILILDPNSLEIKASLRFGGHTNTVRAVMELFGNRLVSGADDYSIRIWNRDGMLLRVIENAHTSAVKVLGFLKNGVVSGGDDYVKVWDFETWTEKGKYKMNIYVMSMLVLANGDLVLGSDRGPIEIWDTSSWTLKKTLLGHTEYVSSLALMANGDFASTSYDRSLKTWSSNGNGTFLKSFQYHSDNIYNGLVLKSGKLASAGRAGIVIY